MKHDVGGLRLEVGGQNILLFSLQPLTSNLMPQKTLVSNI